VVALCDVALERAEGRRIEYYPDARIYGDYREVLRDDEVEVVDVATHPPGRPAIIEAALCSGRHVLSQKPFVEDLDVGERLADLADEHRVRLAVNQNGRWAPYFAYIREAIGAGLIGTPAGIHFAVHWDHNGVAGTAFEDVRHLILYDFAIHWFDALSSFLPHETPRRVFASFRRSASQRVRPAMLAQALVDYDQCQASLVFDADTRFGPLETVYVVGSTGTLTSEGPNSKQQQVTLHTAAGAFQPKLVGSWFSDGFHGTMGELLSAIEEGREPSNSARDNLRSLSLCFAAVASAERVEAVVPGSVRKLPAERIED
jgi:predicted dehydrogenase